MKALVTGAEGFVGPYLLSFLQEQGLEVFGTYFEGQKTDKNFYNLDVTNKKSVNDIITQIKPDFLFHLAGFSSVKQSFENPELCKRINVEGTRNILDAVLNNKLKTKILIVSSAEVYGKPKFTPITEEHPLSANSPYGESRIMQEKLCGEYVKNGLFIVISRSFNHTGPGQPDIFVIPSFAKQIALIEKGKQESIKVGDLDVIRDFSDVRDVVRAYYLALTKNKKCDVYNISSGKGYTLKELLDKMIVLSKSKIKIEKDKERIRKSEIPSLIGDNSKFSKATGWKQEIDIEKTLNDTLGYYRENARTT